jgi:hypothetical protein
VQRHLEKGFLEKRIPSIEELAKDDFYLERKITAGALRWAMAESFIATEGVVTNQHNIQSGWRRIRVIPWESSEHS